MKFSENQLILKPFPQFASGEKQLPELWAEYRQKMISKCGISIFIFGNKQVDGNIVDADGIMKEFIISKKNGNICIPIGITNYVTQTIYETILTEPENYYEKPNIVLPFLNLMANKETTLTEAISTLIELLKKLKK